MIRMDKGQMQRKENGTFPFPFGVHADTAGTNLSRRGRGSARKLRETIEKARIAAKLSSRSRRVDVQRRRRAGLGGTHSIHHQG